MSHSLEKIAFHTLGCKLNFSETSTMVRDFVQSGYSIVKGFENADIQHFYNPISRILEINSSKLLKKIEIFNLLGQSVISNNIDSNSMSINLSNFENSIYLVRVYGESGIKSFKLRVN